MSVVGTVVAVESTLGRERVHVVDGVVFGANRLPSNTAVTLALLGRRRRGRRFVQRSLLTSRRRVPVLYGGWRRMVTSCCGRLRRRCVQIVCALGRRRRRRVPLAVVHRCVERPRRVQRRHQRQHN